MKLKFDPLTIQHLGFRMYSQLPNALAELVANAYDADAHKVDIDIRYGPEPSVSVKDDGHGMSDEELQDRYLVIGRNRVNEGERFSESGLRRAAGRKGLGKLAPFGIGTEVTVRTKRAEAAQWTIVRMDWDAMLGATGGEYAPIVTYESGDVGVKGTVIEVRRLKRVTDIDPIKLATSLARLFNYIDDDFSVTVRPSGTEPIKVKRKLRYEAIEKEGSWAVPGDIPVDDDRGVATNVKGLIIASVRPLPTHLRGITIYVNGRLANDPEFFGVAESSFSASYLTGHIEANYIDELPEDVVATDRRSISWDSDETADLKAYLVKVLNKVIQLRKPLRKKKQEERLKERLQVDPEAWTGTIKGPERQGLTDVLNVLVSPDSDLVEGDRVAVVRAMKQIVPEYADLHWRHIHPAIQRSCEDEYKAGNYHAATLEAIKSYVRAVESRIIGSDLREVNALGHAFALKKDENGCDCPPPVDVVSLWSTAGLADTTVRNIRTAQRDLSTAIWSGFRDPLSHEERRLLEELGIFTYQDCLDALGIVSHLRRRLDGVNTGNTDDVDAEGEAV